MSDRGSVTVTTAAVVACGLALAVGLVGVGQVLAARATASAAADAAALAAAPVTFRAFGADGTPAEEAERFAGLNGAELISCACPSDSTYRLRTVVVEVSVDVNVLGVRRYRQTAVAAAEFAPVELLGDPD